MRLGADGADAAMPADAGAAVRGVDRAARTAAQPAGGDGAQTPRCAEGTVPQGNAVEGIGSTDWLLASAYFSNSQSSA